MVHWRKKFPPKSPTKSIKGSVVDICLTWAGACCPSCKTYPMVITPSTKWASLSSWWLCKWRGLNTGICGEAELVAANNLFIAHSVFTFICTRSHFLNVLLYIWKTHSHLQHPLPQFTWLYQMCEVAHQVHPYLIIVRQVSLGNTNKLIDFLLLFLNGGFSCWA